MPILGLDFGTKRIGLAVADSSDRIAVGAGVLTVHSFSETVAAVCAVVRTRNIGHIVVGLPLSMNGTESAQTVQTRKFARALGGTLALPITLQDERLTTREAERSGAPGGSVDERSAILLLQAYLDRRATAAEGGKA